MYLFYIFKSFIDLFKNVLVLLLKFDFSLKIIIIYKFFLLLIFAYIHELINIICITIHKLYLITQQ